MLVKTTQGNKDVPVTEVTPENYMVPVKEEHLYHAVIEVKKFDPNTGKRQSVPRVQKFGKKSFESGGISDNLKRQGFDVIVLHNPGEWLEQNQKLALEQKAENDRAALKAKQEREEKARIKQEEADQLKIDNAVAKALKSQQEANNKAIEKAVAIALKNAGATKTATTEPKAAAAATEPKAAAAATEPKAAAAATEPKAAGTTRTSTNNQ